MNSQLSLEAQRRDAAICVSGYLANVPVGTSLSIDSSADLLEILEFLVPASLRLSHAEWNTESIDGFLVSSATKTGARSLEMAGICILISDQCVTPFAFLADLAAEDELDAVRIRLGEPGSGPLGISGPSCVSGAARELLSGIDSRIDSIDWAYDISV